MFKCISPCKLNLFLYITGRRPDGYHSLQTLFALLDYGDEMTFEENGTGLEIRGPFDFDVKDNLIYKAHALLEKISGRKIPVTVGVDKKIPAGGGLGGGSSNAGTVLLVLNRMFGLGIPREELVRRSVELGADVPVFVNAHTAFAQGVGEDLTDVDIPERWYLVVSPRLNVSTAAVYADPDLRRDRQVRTLEELMRTPFANDMQEVVAKKYAGVGQILRQLLKYGQSRMTGSGASCFAEFSSREEAERARQSLSLGDAACFVAKCSNRSCLLDSLNEL